MRDKKGEWQEVKLGDIVNFVSNSPYADVHSNG